MRYIFLLIAACLTITSAPPAFADDWHRAESQHYVVHAKLEETDLRELVQLMERFDQLLQSQLGQRTSKGRKAHFYLDRKIERISRAFQIRNSGSGSSWPETTAAFALYDPADDRLFRHHALFYNQARLYADNVHFRPVAPWVKTGVPSFFSTTYLSEDGHFMIGAPDIRRPMKGGVSADKLSKMLLTQSKPTSDAAWSRFFNLSREAIYPLLMDIQNAGVLEKYMNAYSNGKSMKEAATQLGDLKAMTKQIEERRRSRAPRIRQAKLHPHPITEINMRAMRDDEIALVALSFERLVEKTRKRTAERMEKLTMRHPDSSLVWYEFAAAEFARVQERDFAGGPVFRGFGFSNGEILVTANRYSDAKAWAAVKKALELDAGNTRAIRLKAEILLSRLVRSGDVADAPAYEEVRAMLAPLAAEPEQEPLAAAVSFQSYVEQGITPPEEAVELLGRAFVANPGVEEFRYAYAVALSRFGQRDIAQGLLRSMLNDSNYSEAAQKALGNAL